MIGESDLGIVFNERIFFALMVSFSATFASELLMDTQSSVWLTTFWRLAWAPTPIVLWTTLLCKILRYVAHVLVGVCKPDDAWLLAFVEDSLKTSRILCARALGRYGF